MKAQAFRTWLEQLPSLSFIQRKTLLQTLASPHDEPGVQALVNQRIVEVLCCPHCQAQHVHRWGKPGGIQRYRCCMCQQTFNALTGTPAARLKRREAWLTYARLMIDGATIRAAAQVAGIHRTTSFRWRHRLLRLPAQENDVELSSIVEADETYFLESFKGQRQLPRPPRHRGGHARQRGLSKEQIPVLVVQDRQGKHFDGVLPKVDKATVSCLLMQLLSPESLLCTDGAAVYREFAKDQGIAHEALNQTKGEHVRLRVLHLQHVNAYDARLKRWMYRFHGVATKYLGNYLGWRRLLEKCGRHISPAAVLLHAIG